MSKPKLETHNLTIAELPGCTHSITTTIAGIAVDKSDPFAAVRPYVDLLDKDGKDLTIPLEALPYPERFNLIVKPVGIKRKVGSIILADQTVDAQQWTHGTAVVCKVGPSVFKGQRFKDMDLKPSDGPKVGDLVYIMPRNPNRFEVDGELYMLIADDGIFARLDPKHAHRITYKF
jgi:co-chaperonin GroES (HSP10)